MPDIYTAPKNHHLSAFVVRPKNIRFETQERKEKIILLLRRHWITNLAWIFLTMILTISPFFFSRVPGIALLLTRYAVIILIPWYLFVFAFILESFLTWYFNVNIVTDERIVDINFYSLLYKEISHCKIDKIQDVSFNMGGIMGTFFNYGNVLIQTASEVPVFQFEAVPQPALVVRKLNDLILEEEQEKLEGRVR